MYQSPITGDATLGSPTMAALEAQMSRMAERTFMPALVETSQLRLIARGLLGLRRERDGMFGGGLFSDPAWDILLTLYLSKLQQVRLKVSNVIVESGVPSTTGLRWITTLTERGILKRSANPTDARSHFVELDDRAALALSSHLIELRDMLTMALR